MFRTILLVLIAIIYLIATLPVLLILSIMYRRDPLRCERIATAMIRWVFLVMKTVAGTSITVLGTERIPKDCAVLFAGNHRSIFDIILTQPLCPASTGYVAKDTLGKVPLFAQWSIYIGCLFFNRDNIRDGIEMIRKGTERLQKGLSVFIFPEGTRNRNEKDYPLLPFHEGSFRMAAKSGAAVVPVALNNTISVWEGHLPAVRKASVVIEFCDPIYPEALSRTDRKHIGVQVSAAITEALQRNESLL